MELTYPQVGATQGEILPVGYGHVFRDARIGAGRPAFEAAADDLFTWQMHRRAGLAVVGEPGRAAPGIDVTLRLAWIRIPCRVVYTIEERDRRGFAYGTLPGHPEQGEEAFVLDLTEAGDVRFRIRAFSRPASLLARAGGPLTRLVQEFATDRYVAAVSR
ncbi:DUF1990 family protein [Actinoplanes sp. CA-131856]